MYSYLLSLFIHCLLPFIASSAADISTDQSALLALKSYVTSDPGQILTSNWSSQSSVCNWIGITCGYRHHRVTALNISNMGLKATIPPHIGNLSFLVSLDLSINHFHGNFPPDFSHLHRLKVLNVSFNNLSGSLPTWLGSLHKLQVLYLRNNSFTGSIPPSISNISNLEVLGLTFNSLQGNIPVEIGRLQALKSLSVYYNHLSGWVPSEIFNISSLETISLAGNTLSGTLPDNVCHRLRGLKWLDLSENKFSGHVLLSLSNCSQLQLLGLNNNHFGGVIPKEIQNLKVLEMLYLEYNNIQGEIPMVFGNLTALRILSLYENRVTGKMPPEIFNITSLEMIDIYENNISGTIPDNTCESLPRLWRLNLEINMFSGKIPGNLSQCTELQVLGLSYNKFTGSIPKEIGSLKKLNMLFIHTNNLEGSIPKELGNMTNLRILECGFNNLRGTIPQELGNLQKLEVLRLNNNYLSGFIPFDALIKLRYLRFFALNDNPLNGVLPNFVGNLSSSLQHFDASNCGIGGSIPHAIGNLSNLILLNLSGNGLIGSTPSTVRDIQELQTLDLGDNKLSRLMLATLCGLQNLYGVYLENNGILGSIPECLGNITSLRYISLGFNKLSGIIPTSFWNLQDLLVLNLSANSLSGSLPFEVGNLKSAIDIDLSMNQLSNGIPASIGALQNLQVLYLLQNKLQGSIPDAVGKMVSLVSLDLSHNNLSGSIPRSLELLHYLKDFDVSFNHLSGEIPTRGPFRDFTSESFDNNEELCGKERFGVPPCPAASTHSLRGRKVIRIILPLLGVAAIIGVIALLLVCLRYRKKNRKHINDREPMFGGTLETISSYELLRATDGYDERNLLGRGSFGSVYRGKFDDGRIMAVKVFNLQVEGAFKSFEVECQILRNLRHRNLTKVISSCSNPNLKALVLEFMPNGSLEKWLYSDNCSLDVMQGLNILIDVANALHYLHSGYSVPVVHSDLKPSNILLDQDMVAHITDFGISKLLGHEHSVTYTQTIATFGYMAPEYGLEGWVSTRCDVYSYGIILMEVFTRKRPNDEMFEGDFSLRTWVANAALSTLAQGMDASLLGANEKYLNEKLGCVSSIMEMALNCTKEAPKERPTMGEVIVALEKIKLQLLPYHKKFLNM